MKLRVDFLSRVLRTDSTTRPLSMNTAVVIFLLHFSNLYSRSDRCFWLFWIVFVCSQDEWCNYAFAGEFPLLPLVSYKILLTLFSSEYQWSYRAAYCLMFSYMSDSCWCLSTSLRWLVKTDAERIRESLVLRWDTPLYIFFLWCALMFTSSRSFAVLP